MINKTFEYKGVDYEVFDVPRHTNACEKCCLRDNVCKDDKDFYCDDFMDKYEYAEIFNPITVVPKGNIPSDDIIEKILILANRHYDCIDIEKTLTEIKEDW